MAHEGDFISFHSMDLDHTLTLHCMVGVGKDLVYGAWMSLTSFHSMACRISIYNCTFYLELLSIM